MSDKEEQEIKDGAKWVKKQIEKQLVRLNPLFVNYLDKDKHNKGS